MAVSADSCCLALTCSEKCSDNLSVRETERLLSPESETLFALSFSEAILVPLCEP
ncbi:Uncharacterised protein [Vibrio cholerae]|nr:Uncharacterised protein [Vibrio cholerae]CSB22681.1 Uncharacterised protein [Vibrio cholerae]